MTLQSNLPRYFFIFVLLTVNIAAATFMVNESAHYYMMLYPANAVVIPWAAATLAEVFQHIMMILTGKRITWFFRLLAIVVFGVTVAGAAYRVLKPIEIAQAKTGRETKLVKILEQEITDNRNDRVTFSEQNQKENTAMSAKERRKRVDDLTEILMQAPTETVDSISGFEIVLLFTLRLLIQTCALVCAWKIGDMYRSRSKQTGPKQVVRVWRIKTPGKIGFVGIVEYKDGSFLAATRNERRPYKNFNNATKFFSGTKYAGRLPLEAQEINR